ncbi:MAG: 50S ribosomal protein L11 methyltransferase [Flavobacteriales bacterium]
MADQVYTIVDLRVAPLIPWRDVLLAELTELGYDSFEETLDGLRAFVLEGDFDAQALEATTVFALTEVEVAYKTSRLEPQNWNAKWESQFDPIDVDGRLRIRAPFHPAVPGIPEVIIQPQMSFGTGHHPTTFQMADALLDLDLNGKDVLDMGTGTGVLAILAKQHGAARVQAIDIDHWSVENTRENAERNGVEGIEILEGEADLISGVFDVIFANINRNILLAQMGDYARALKPRGAILFSGFYPVDVPHVTQATAPHGWQLELQTEKEGWSMLAFRRPA